MLSLAYVMMTLGETSRTCWLFLCWCEGREWGRVQEGEAIAGCVHTSPIGVYARAYCLYIHAYAETHAEVHGDEEREKVEDAQRAGPHQRPADPEVGLRHGRRLDGRAVGGTLVVELAPGLCLVWFGLSG
jgi:hypothetical protein